jgi:hypothetical protein
MALSRGRRSGGGGMTTPIACPFCDHPDVVVDEGYNFRWLLAVCENCGAKGPEVPIQTDAFPSPISRARPPRPTPSASGTPEAEEQISSECIRPN